MEFEVKISRRARVAWLPVEILNVLGEKAKAIPNENAVLLYPHKARPKDVLRSLEIIRMILQARNEGKDKRTEEDSEAS